MRRPSDTSLPFFAYGIFKPGQLSYYRIKCFVKDCVKAEIFGRLKERDGMPLLDCREPYVDINGYLLYFYDGKEDKAYDAITELEPKAIYKWEKHKVNKISANVLHAKPKALKYGAQELEWMSDWDGRIDPSFTIALKEVQKVVDDVQNLEENGIESDKARYSCIFRLEMAYMLLWSVIERYATMKYYLGTNPCKVSSKVWSIADDPVICFEDILRRHVNETRELWSTKDVESRSFKLDPKDGPSSIRYYYQMRHNIVHRGKAVTQDFRRIKSSLTELHNIFEDLLEESFEELDC